MEASSLKSFDRTGIKQKATKETKINHLNGAFTLRLFGLRASRSLGYSSSSWYGNGALICQLNRRLAHLEAIFAF
jgi:hypothetical protein